MLPALECVQRLRWYSSVGYRNLSDRFACSRHLDRKMSLEQRGFVSVVCLFALDPADSNSHVYTDVSGSPKHPLTVLVTTTLYFSLFSFYYLLF